MLLDRVVRQGRAFGIHVVLGSQTLERRPATLARATMGQMVIRIALQCNEADAQLIMDDNNPAPRFLTVQGEGIYNDMAGAVEGNSPFQTVLAIGRRSRRAPRRDPLARPGGGHLTARAICFRRNAPASSRGQCLASPRSCETPKIAATPRIWLGEPNAIKGPTEVVFPRQSGSHLLIVGQAEEPILAMMSSALLALSAQLPP